MPVPGDGERDDPALRGTATALIVSSLEELDVTVLERLVPGRR